MRRSNLWSQWIANSKSWREILETAWEAVRVTQEEIFEGSIRNLWWDETKVLKVIKSREVRTCLRLLREGKATQTKTW